MRLIFNTLILLCVSSVGYAEELWPVQQRLIAEMESVTSTQPNEVRKDVVNDFINALQELEDKGLGDVRLFEGENNTEKRQLAQAKLEMIVSQLEGLVETYHQTVKPILLNNIKLKRKDAAYLHNQNALIKLLYSSKNNHATGKPVTGIWDYKQDVSDSLFSSRMVDAGIKVNFPELAEADWIKQALAMETELIVLRKMHLRDKIKQPEAELEPGSVDSKKVVSGEANKFIVTNTSTSKIKILTPDISYAAIEAIDKKLLTRPHQTTVAMIEDEASAEQRMLIVQGFMKDIKRLEAENETFKSDLVAIVETYEKTVLPILLDNISLERVDVGAKANMGNLIGLFHASFANHNTGRPILGKLRYKADVSDSFFSSEIAEVGPLIDNPEMANEPYIKNALNMEAELAALLQKHKEYLKTEGYNTLIQ